MLITYGDRFTSSGERFGFNADFTAFFPRNADGSEGLLAVNHEYVGTDTDYYGQAFTEVVGGVPHAGRSEVRRRRQRGRTSASNRTRAGSVMASALNRRITADTLMIADGPALQGVSNVGGTLGNCSGGHTPWNTLLTCEENYQDYVPEDLVTNGIGTVGGLFQKNGTHFGWVVEIDPHDPQLDAGQAHLARRFRHENVALRTARERTVIAYMGDDRTNGHVYKFVSAARFMPGSAANKGLLADGRLFSAQFNADGTGRWIELAPGTALNAIPDRRCRRSRPAPPRLAAVYGTQGNILIDAYRASNLAGATPTARPEDVEVHPADNSVFIAFTANATAQNSLFTNIYGELVRLVECERRRHGYDVHVAALEGRRPEQRGPRGSRVRGAGQPVVRQGRQHVGGHATFRRPT